MSAPSSSGRCSAGVAKVLSTAASAPTSRAAAMAPARSTTLSSGLDGDSSQTSRVSGVSAWRSAPRSAMSTIEARIPQRGRKSWAMARMW